ncbi:Carboxylesterase NlhH [Actinomadura rubteroloni]|uniref:Carboxylesterase NlhH n=1 Tax=Actinomadura rubteroloni TaxID=1926885 RepID=A0A2P4UBN1_9ACTN|nr:alpha/beta hydrolase [Actinomadura rubteroloni]POM22442.1 Carboxylesterase NlhH [Actinomadura rubteroloni]
MALHPQTARFLEQLRGLAALAVEPPSIEESRRVLGAEYPLERPELAHVEDLAVDGPGGPVPVRRYRPVPGEEPLPALVYLHGGGWVLGGLENVDVSCRDLAAATRCTVLSVDYRLAPEHPFPAAVEDAWAVTGALFRTPERFGIDPARIAVAGDSAGGNLAAAVALLARDADLPLAHQLLVYPVTDTARDTPSWGAYGSGYGLDAKEMARFMDLYRGDADPCHPLLAPLRAPDLSGVAPATVITAEYDILRDEGEAYARRLAAAGVAVEHRRFPGVVHSFFLLPELFDTGAEARTWAVDLLRVALGVDREPVPGGS